MAARHRKEEKNDMSKKKDLLTDCSQSKSLKTTSGEPLPHNEFHSNGFSPIFQDLEIFVEEMQGDFWHKACC